MILAITGSVFFILGFAAGVFFGRKPDKSSNDVSFVRIGSTVYTVRKEHP